MTPEEILKDLRDIELPPMPESGVADFSPIPLLVAGMMILAVLAVRWFRRGRFRREVSRRLGALKHEPDRAKHWAGLITLLQWMAPRFERRSPPPAVFLPPRQIGDRDVATLRRHIRTLAGR